jgi:hypothetical protein
VCTECLINFHGFGGGGLGFPLGGEVEALEERCHRSLFFFFCRRADDPVHRFDDQKGQIQRQPTLFTDDRVNPQQDASVRQRWVITRVTALL